MKKMMSRFWHTLSITSGAIIGLGIASVAAAAEDVLPALEYDLTGARLLKVNSSQLFESTNGGDSWQAIPLPEAVRTGQLVVAPAAAEQTLYIAGPSIGVQRSDDNGDSWYRVDEGLPSRNVIAFSAHRHQVETLYAKIADDGIYQSDDAGESWRKKDSGPVQPVRRLVHSDMEGSMQTVWLYAVSDDAVRLSMDCFCGWRPTGELDADTVYDVAYEFDEPERVYVATDRGLWVSDNGGKAWLRIEGDAPELVAITLAPEGTLYGLDRVGELVRSNDQGRNWRAIPDA